MTNTIKNTFKRMALVAGLAGLLSCNVNAQSVFTGLRGPTNLQVDDRVSYTEKESQKRVTTRATGNNLILKYFNGKEQGIFGFANIPYKSLKSGEKSSEGLGDIALGIGPRFETPLANGKLGVLSYLGPVLPTGNKNSTLALGTGRVDGKAGFFGTWLSNSKKYETDFALDYVKTENSKISDDITGGIVLGGQVTPNLRFVAGPLFSYKEGGANNGDYTFSGRANFRYTPSGNLGKRLHFEGWYDQQLTGQGPSSPAHAHALTLIARANF